jgi:3-hydroxyisobutyrate dehydrogenase-like beta-hydroxyacid dehydrogenase
MPAPQQDRSTADTAPEKQRVGVVGLGAIGLGVSRSLARSGRTAAVFDIRPEAADALDGVVDQLSSAAELAHICDVVLIAVLDEAQVHDALTGPNGILAGARPGLIAVLLSTVPVPAVHRLADICAGRGVHVLDCGVTPGHEAPNNNLVGFVGGPDDVVAQAMPVLEDFARAIVHCGPLGSGMTVKIARNIISYCTWSAVDEAVNLAGAAGVPAATMLAALREADAEHPQYLKNLEVRVSRMPVPRERVENALVTAAKDLGAATDLAAAHGIDLPLTELTKPMIRNVFALRDIGNPTR